MFSDRRMEIMPLRQYGPWYRGGVQRSYIPPSYFVSVGYAVCLVMFAIFFLLCGSIMTGVSYHEPAVNPEFDTPFFRKAREARGPSVFRTVGPIILGIGSTLLLISISLCVVVAFLARKQENKRREQQGQPDQPLSTEVPLQPPPASAYPHQPPPPPSDYPYSQGQQNYPTATGYPSQPIGNIYPQQFSQNQYPSQPANYYLPTSTYPPPSESPYPVAPQNFQYPFEKEPL